MSSLLDSHWLALALTGIAVGYVFRAVALAARKSGARASFPVLQSPAVPHAAEPPDPPSPG